MNKTEKESIRKIANELLYDKDNHYFKVLTFLRMMNIWFELTNYY